MEDRDPLGIACAQHQPTELSRGRGFSRDVVDCANPRLLDHRALECCAGVTYRKPGRPGRKVSLQLKPSVRIILVHAGNQFLDCSRGTGHLPGCFRHRWCCIGSSQGLSPSAQLEIGGISPTTSHPPVGTRGQTATGLMARARLRPGNCFTDRGSRCTENGVSEPRSWPRSRSVLHCWPKCLPATR